MQIGIAYSLLKLPTCVIVNGYHATMFRKIFNYKLWISIVRHITSSMYSRLTYKILALSHLSHLVLKGFICLNANLREKVSYTFLVVVIYFMIYIFLFRWPDFDGLFGCLPFLATCLVILSLIACFVLLCLHHRFVSICIEVGLRG